MLHDTTEFSLHRAEVAAVGMTTKVPTRKLDGKPKHYSVCGILIHSSVAVTVEPILQGDLSAEVSLQESSQPVQRLGL